MNGILESPKLRSVLSANLLTGIKKRCSRCGLTKSKFYKDNRHVDGLTSECADCLCSDRKIYQANNKDHIKTKKHETYLKNRHRHLAKNKTYYSENKETILKQHYQYVGRKHRMDKKFKISRNISGAIYRSLKRNKQSNHWESLVGYTIDELITSLERTMPIGFTWNDYLSGILEIDHKKPLKLFSYKSHEDNYFKEAWSLDNLQLLTAIDNKRKAANYDFRNIT